MWGVLYMYLIPHSELILVDPARDLLLALLIECPSETQQPIYFHDA